MPTGVPTSPPQTTTTPEPRPSVPVSTPGSEATPAAAVTPAQPLPAQASSTARKRRLPKLPLPKLRLAGQWKRIAIILLALAVLLAAGSWLVSYFTLPAHITKLEFRRALSSRTTDAPVKETFAIGEPVMLVFDFDRAKPNTPATVTLKKDKSAVRTVDLPYLRGGDKTAADKGQRFVSLVNGSATKLEPGTYTVTVASGARELVSKSFVVK